MTHIELKLKYNVSIHAPWEGCDGEKNQWTPSTYQFQFTHPGKGATQDRKDYNIKSISFNSRTLGRVRL